ncbi:MAG: UvrD-helicase domain-containing protein [Spirochaetes bacterium]|nr:UvrD-helicase domain-containing protein [Spirochaetota bacterium]
MTATESAHEILEKGGHAFIEASAGSGKTTLLIELIAAIIGSNRATISEILCVTFTEKAASELKARTYKKLAELGDDAAARAAYRDFSQNRIGTIHSFCLNSLAQNTSAALPELTNIGSDERELFEEAREYIYRVEWAQIEPAALAMFLQTSKFGKGGRARDFDDELRQKALWCFAMGKAPIIPLVATRAEVHDALSFKAWTLYAIVQKMQELASERNAVTFSRMVTLFADAVKDKKFATTIATQYRYVLIDEFQDTDTVQWDIFRTLFIDSKTEARLVVVGDPKQAIYKFRGADVFVYLKARELLRALGASKMQLDTNFRSAPEITNFFNAVFTARPIASAWEKADIEYIVAKNGAQTPSTHDACTGVEIFQSDAKGDRSLDAYCIAVAENIEQLRTRQPDWSIAIMATKHKTLRLFADALRARSIPYSYYGEKPDFNRIEFVHLRFFLESLLASPEQGLRVAEQTIFLKNRPDAIDFFNRLKKHADKMEIYALIRILAQDAHALHLLLDYGADETVVYAWRLMLERIVKNCGKEYHDVVSLVAWLSALAESEENDNENLYVDILRDEDAVTLITVQSAKGLEWNVAVLADGINDSRWKDFAFFHNRNNEAVVPVDSDAFNASDDKRLSIEDEAKIAQLNLLYVALTRAKNKFLCRVAPPNSEKSPGPVAAFLQPWLAKNCGGARIVALSEFEATAPTVAIHRKLSPPIAVDHGNIPERYSERRSFSNLVRAHFDTVDFIPDDLPRGTEIGLLLHSLLEMCQFHEFKNPSGAYRHALQKRVAEEIGKKYSLQNSDPLRITKITSRIVEIIAACAAARLPLSVTANENVRLQDLPTENLWRETPFWSAAANHKILANMRDDVRRTMYGITDLVFTPDHRRYFVLDYKSNSLSDVVPENIAEYGEAHYGEQAQIYCEALTAYLQAMYPGEGRAVVGCHFLFLRYLVRDTANGVWFRLNK